jgi:hypothetical protein
MLYACLMYRNLLHPTLGGWPTGAVKADTERLAASKAAALAVGAAQ